MSESIPIAENIESIDNTSIPDELIKENGETNLSRVNPPVEEEERAYPSARIQMMLDNGLIMDIKDYTDKYKIYTNIEDLSVLGIVVEFFKSMIPILGNKEKFAEEIKELITISEECKVPFQNIAVFFNIVHARFLMAEYAFIAYSSTKDNDGNLMYTFFDISERYEEIKYITTKECGSCRKKAENLLKCKNCLKAAYCDKRCQSNDWSFHKRYCVCLTSKK